MKPAIVVTGAASGIGRALSLAAAPDAAVMVLIDLLKGDLDAAAAELAVVGVETHTLVVDLADREAGQHIAQALSERGLFCDVLINSAGFGVFGSAAETSREEQVRLLDVNARALTDLSLRFLPGMLERGRGGILNVGSITGYTAGPYMATYFASKAFVKSFTSALAAEVAGTGVTVTCLIPGVVRTPFFDHCPVEQTRLFKFAPRSNAPDIAATGWRGFKAGKRLVIPRLVDRIIAGACILLPERVLLWFIAVCNGRAARPAADSAGHGFCDNRASRR